ncbi:hypothetical protein SAMN05192550_2558 [Flavobacterium glycines]|jgi:transposase-like protein|uniref:Prophage protein n=1 Tax=Flavobacterium glycines TaxID=551990 RepID=A0A1B9DGF8_9FLAO|nr:hypothetical protein [Flavobacterium glycines]OCB68740.1 hypothetical protein FBGL_16255 [Flavobacterium glycines]GEL11391.1 hypothetical protein FGL01_21300 [Flavobacterium glycines]SDJ66568.1 hypothetical protein SAMN05192550_2558 [Flavobacterium glycines]
MDLKEIKATIISKKIVCSIFGHKIVTSRNITNHLKEYRCTVCKMELTNDEEGYITYLTPELKEVNEALVSFYQKKLLAKQH